MYFRGFPLCWAAISTPIPADGRDKAVIRHLCDEPEELAAAIEMIDLYEPASAGLHCSRLCMAGGFGR